MSPHFSTHAFNLAIDRAGTRAGGITRRELIVHDVIDSTSTDLVRRLGEGATAGTIVIASRQTAGRGRRGNVWRSDDRDNLYISAAVSVGGHPTEELPFVPLAAGVAIIEALRETGFFGALLKWPNDVLVDGKKLGGILCEAPNMAARPVIAVVGLGLNLGRAEFPEDLAGSAVCLSKVFEGKWSKESLAAGWISRLEAWNRDRAGLLEAWRANAEPFGRRVVVGDVSGITTGLNDSGHLLIKRDDDRLIAVPGGIVENVD